MAKTPFFKVIVKSNQRDISDMITKFSHELAVDQDNLLVLNIEKVDPSFIDDPDLQEGTILTFQYGYAAGKTSQNYLARISDVNPNYGSIIDITIRATDLGLVMKKTTSKKIWQNIRSSDIVKTIALANGLNAVVEQTDTIHKNMPQGGKTDYDFIKYLSSIEKNGSWRFYLRNDEIHFKRLKLEKASFKTLRWNNADGDVMSFKPYSQETLKNAASRDTVVTTVNPFTNQPVQTVINDSSAKDDVKLGEYVYDFNANQKTYTAQIQGQSSKFNLNNNNKPSQIQKSQADTNRAGKHVYSPARETSEAQNVGNKVKKKSALSDYMATVTTEGDPDYLEDQVISMAGVSKKDTGNWYVSRANHIITPDSSYITRMTWNKNAGKKPIGDKTKQTNINKTVGPDQKVDTPVKKEVGVYTYDEDAKLISAPNQ
jgi:phage protein D